LNTVKLKAIIAAATSIYVLLLVLIRLPRRSVQNSTADCAMRAFKTVKQFAVK
jgi:hypothetical protein